MPARTGDQYLDGLRDSRSVVLNGERITDVTTHPLLGPSARGMAGYFDYQHVHAADCLIPNPHGDGQISASHLIPQSPDDLATRHRAFDRFARYSMGMLGRTPDYVNCTYAGFAARTDVLAQNGNHQGAENMVAFQRHIAEHDSALTHVLIHPVADKSLADVEGLNGELALRNVGETAEGIVVRGARILGTLGPFADEVAVYTGQPFPTKAPYEIAPYALNFAIPLATPGLTIICRDHYGTGVEVPNATADHPVSARFDEQDAFLVFDDVVVPHDRVFIDGDIETYNQIMLAGWSANIMQQTSIRARVKLEFAYELCSRMAATLNDRRAETLRMCGEIWSYAELTRAAIQAAEAGAHRYGPSEGATDAEGGAFFPDDRPFRALRPTIPGWMARANEIIKLIGSHNLLATPTAADFDHPQLRPLLETYLPGAARGQRTSASDRTALFRTAWDFAGSALGSRTELYERYYLASAARMFQVNHVLAQREQEWTLVPEFLAAANASAGAPDPAP